MSARSIPLSIFAVVFGSMLASSGASAQTSFCPAPPGEPPCGISDGPASLSDTGGIDVAVGNPVHALTGVKIQTELDATPGPGVFGLEIRRHYSSAHAGVDGPFGAGWTLSYDTRLYRVGNTAQIIQADGRRVLFRIGGVPDSPTCTGERPEDGELIVAAPSAGRGAAGYRWRWPDGREIAFDEHGRLIGIRLRGGDGGVLEVVVARDAAGRIERVVDPRGQAMQLHHDASGRVVRIDHPRGSWHYRVDGRGALQSVTAPNGVVRRYEHGDPAHPFHLTAIRMSGSPPRSGPGGSSGERAAGEDRVGHRPVDQQPVDQQPVDQQQVRQQQVRQQPVGERLVASWSYERGGRVAKAVVVNDGGGEQVFRFAYGRDAATAGHDAATAGQDVAAEGYDAVADGHDVASNPAPAVARASTAVASGDAVTRIATADGSWVRYRHRQIGGRHRPVVIESAACDACAPDLRRIDYDDAGRITRTRWRPAGAATASRMAPARDVLATDIGFERDASGRIVRIVAGDRDAVGARRLLRRFEYADAQSRLPALIVRPSVEPGREHRLVLTWGDTAAIRDRLVRIDEHGYRDGEPIERTVHYRHDEAGLLSAIDGPLPGDADTYRVVHDPRRAGRIIGLIDPLGQPVLQRDAARLLGGPLLAGIDPGSGRDPIFGGGSDPDPDRFQVASGEVVHRAPNGATTRINVDDFGRIVRIASDDSGVEHLVHDEADRVVLQTDATGAAVAIRHDAVGRPLERVVLAPAGKPEVTRYHYDGARLIAVEHPVASEAIVHDPAGRVVERAVTVHVGPGAGTRFVRRFGYRGDARIPSMVELPGGTRLTIDPAADGSPAGAVRWSDHPWQAPIDLWRRQVEDGTVHWTFGNGVTRTLRRDAAGRIASIDDRRGSDRIAASELALDRHGRIEAIADLHGGWRFAYDRLGRLIIAQDPQGPWWFAYDDSGNRLLAKTPAQTLDPSTSRTDSSAPAGSPMPPVDVGAALPTERPIRAAYADASHRALGPAYDAAGRPLRWRGMDLTWHPGGRIAAVARHGQSVARYYYNHRGERVARQVGSDWTYYDHDGGRLVAQQRHGEHRTRHFVYEGELPMAMIESPSAANGLVGRLVGAIRNRFGQRSRMRWLHLDHRGAPIASTDPDGRVVWTARLSPDGERLSISTGPMHEDPLLRLPGQIWDAETGLHDNGHRTYDPVLGRYLSPDPLGLRAGSNPYSYAGGDPINRVDPTGLLLFAFDGTWNTEADRTNVRRIWDLYGQQEGERLRPGGESGHYERGIGTTGTWINQNYQGVTANEWMVAVDRQFERFVEAASALTPGEMLFVDVVGFSRGAIQARAFGQRVAQALRGGTMRSQGLVTLRFMGLYDAVATNMFDGMSAAQVRCVTDIAMEWQHVTHLIALDEYRPNFRGMALGTQPGMTGIRQEIVLVGSHSNIGGGYDPAAGRSPVRNRSDLSNVALWVMMEEARQSGVLFRPLPAEVAVVGAPVLNDETHSSGGDPERMIDVGGHLRPLADLGLGGLSRSDARALGAPRNRGSSWDGPGSFPASQNPAVVGRIDMAAYCLLLVSRSILPKCPP
ncbi:MAG: RHS repeat-associated core domain-containing protein [Lautropia sp.]